LLLKISRPSTTISTTEKAKQDATAMPLPVSTSTQQPSQPQGTPDPYLTHFDPRSEHQSYKQAQMRLEEVHKEKVTKVSSINCNENGEMTLARIVLYIFTYLGYHIFTYLGESKGTLV